MKTRILATRSLTGEGLDLELVLLRAREAEDGGFRVMLVVQLDPMMVVEPGVEGECTSKKPVSPWKTMSWRAGHLCREIEGEFEVAEIGPHRRVDVRAEHLVALERSPARAKARVGHEAGRHRRVDADVGQGAAAERQLVAQCWRDRRCNRRTRPARDAAGRWRPKRRARAP